MHAVITAGGRVDESFAARIGTDVKALARFRGQTVLERAIEAARTAGAQRVAVVGGADVRAQIGGLTDLFIDEAQTGAGNVHLALHAFADSPLLYLTSDLPFLDGAVLGAFLRRVPPGAIAMPLASEAQYAARFPGAPEHVTEIGGERIANGSVFFIPSGAAPTIDAAAQKLFNARKDLFGMAKLLGPSLLLKFALRRLRIADIEAKAAALLGVPASAVRDAPPELCFDVDTLADYDYALAHG